MIINSFKLSSDKKSIELNISDASSVTSLLLFTDKTYKDYSDALDLSNLLSSDSVQTINITPSDFGVKQFEGLYYAEVEDDSARKGALTSVLTRFEECILEKIVKINLDDDCLESKYINTINAQATLEGIRMATENKFIEEAINLINNLKKYCSNKCKSCGEYNNIITNTYLDYNDQ